jgi:hypothetical protein
MKERANEISRAYYEKHKNDKPKPERPKRRKIYKKKVCQGVRWKPTCST